MLVGAVVEINKSENELFLIAKGYLEELLRRILVPAIDFKPTSSVPYLHPSKSIEIYSGKKKIGVFGVIHPLVATEFSLERAAVVVFELGFEVLKRVVKKQIDYSPPIKEALVKIDLAIKAKNWQEAEKKINRVFGNLLVKSELIDVYQNKYTVRLWLLPTKKTTGKGLQKLIDRAIN